MGAATLFEEGHRGGFGRRRSVADATLSVGPRGDQDCSSLPATAEPENDRCEVHENAALRPLHSIQRVWRLRRRGVDALSGRDGPKSRRPVLVKAIALGSGCLFALGVGELGARIYFELLSKGGQGVQNTRGFGMPDARLGYRPEPGAKVRSWGPEFDFEYSINAKGLRDDRETPYARTSGMKRVLVAGDSFTFGAGVANADRYSDRLEELLEDTEVVNTGVSGWGTDQQLLFYEEDGQRYAPDVVVVGYLTSHIRRNAVDAREGGRDGMMVPKPRFILDEHGELELTNVPVPAARPPKEHETRRVAENEARRGSGLPIPFKRELRENSALYKLLHSRLRDRVHHLMQPDTIAFPEYSEDRPEWWVTRAIILEFARQARANGSEFVLVLIPNKELISNRQLDRRPHAMLRAVAAEGGFPVLDLLDAMDAAADDAEGRPYFQSDAHLSPRGHEVVAQELAALLQSL